MNRKCIISAKVTDTIWLFLMPFVEFLKKSGYEVKIIVGKGNHVLNLKKAGLPLKIIDFHFSLNPVTIWKLFQITRKFLLSEQPNIIICNDPSASFITRLAAKSVGIKNVIYFCHGLPFAPHSNFFKKIFFYILEKLAGYATDAIITMNSYDYNICKTLCKKVYKINGVGVDLSKFSPLEINVKLKKKQEFGIPDQVKVIGFIGRLIPEKGIKYFLEASKGLILRKKRLMFLIAGDGPLKQELLHFIKINQLAKNINFLGYIRDVYKLMQVIDVLILPTYYIEGLPRVILEGMASGVPVIATNIRGCRDIIRNEENGLLIPYKDTKSIVEAVIKLTEDKNLYNKIAFNAYIEVKKYYTISFVIKQFSEIIQNFCRE